MAVSPRGSISARMARGRFLCRIPEKRRDGLGGVDATDNKQARDGFNRIPAGVMMGKTWNEEFERSIAAWGEGDLAAGRVACDRLMNHPKTPSDYRANARCNAVHYAWSLRDVPGYREWEVSIPLPEGWFAFNPSIVEVDGGYQLSARCANYAMPGWVIAPGDDRYRSAAAIMPLDRDGMPAGESLLLRDFTVSEDDRDDQYVGPEDLRLIRLGDRLMASGSVARRLGPERRRTICMGLFDLDLEGGAIGNPRWLSGAPGTVEKNWMPVVAGDGGSLWFVHSCGPTIALECNPDAGLTGRSETAPAPLMAEGMRGGTQLLPSGEGWLGLVHESADWAVGKRTYLHRVARFGADWRMTHLSHPFRFQGEEIEFAAGLARCGEDVLITFGTGDNACWVARLPEASLTGLLLPMETFGEAPAGQQVRAGRSAAAPDAGLFGPAQAGLPATWEEILAGPAFVLNLDRRPERMAAARQRIAAAGFSDVRRFPAVDGFDPGALAAAWAARGSPKLAAPPYDFLGLPGAQACYLSHLAIWNEIDRQQLNWAVVLEDDVDFHPRWWECAEGLYAATPRQVDLCYLGGRMKNPPVEGPIADQPTWTTHAYLVTRRGLPRLRAAAEPGDVGVNAIDNMLVRAQMKCREEKEEAIWWSTWNLPPGERSMTSRAEPFADRGLVFQDRQLSSDCLRATLATDDKRADLRRLLQMESLYDGFDAAEFPPDLGEVWASDHPVFEHLVRTIAPRRILELGTWKGRSAIAMATLASAAGAAAEVVCIDTWLGGVENLVSYDLYTGAVRRGAAGEVDLSASAPSLRRKHGYPQLYFTFISNVIAAGLQEVITPLPLSTEAGLELLWAVGATFELVYVDASHLYEPTLRDLLGAWKVLAPDGVMFGDDAFFPPVRRAAEEAAQRLGRTLLVSGDNVKYAICESRRTEVVLLNAGPAETLAWSAAT